MTFKCDFDALVEALNDVSEVVEDKMSSEDLRNVLFRVGTEGAEVIGLNKFIIYRRRIPIENYVYESDAEDDGMFQLRSKELLGYLNSYKNLRRTKVDEVSFETGERGNIICKVLEMDTDSGVQTSSTWAFSPVPIKRNVLAGIDKEKPEEIETLDTKNIMFYTKNLGSLLQAGTNLYAHICFGEEYVVVFSTAHVSLMKNILGSTFSKVKLSYRAVSFLDKVVCREPTVGVGKDGSYLYLETETGVAYIRYTSELPDYSIYVGCLDKKDNGVVLDRLYLSDLLRRLKLLNESVEFTVESEQIGLRNSKFTGSAGVLNAKGIEGSKKFKVMPEVLGKAVLGSDEEFSNELFFYFVQQQRGTALVITDDSGSWFSVLNTKFY